MRRVADLLLGRGQAQLLAHRAVEPWTGVGSFRPRAVVERAEDDDVGLLQARLSIWGPFEARLQQTDVIILGSLNDGTWPEAADPGPWLNRPMRKELGLPSPEQEIGYAAHDFTSLLGASRVYIVRAEKIDGVPTVPSRWLMRVQALLAGLGISDRLATRSPLARLGTHARRGAAATARPRARAAARPLSCARGR